MSRWLCDKRSSATSLAQLPDNSETALCILISLGPKHNLINFAIKIVGMDYLKRYLLTRMPRDSECQLRDGPDSEDHSLRGSWPRTV